MQLCFYQHDKLVKLYDGSISIILNLNLPVVSKFIPNLWWMSSKNRSTSSNEHACKTINHHIVAEYSHLNSKTVLPLLNYNITV